jgi:putative ABC transport system permease protein
MAIAQAVRFTIKELEPARAVYDLAPLEEWIDDAFAQNRLRALVLGLFAVTALALSSFGLYGTLSYVASLRRREVGLRLAVGAGRRDIVRQFLMKGLRVVATAAAAGLVLSLALSRLLSGMLFGVTPSDPATLAGVTGLVLLVTALAAFIPARRASRVDPIVALRCE